MVGRGREMMAEKTYCRHVSIVSSKQSYLLSFKSDTSCK
jgi:hypothetical protein